VDVLFLIIKGVLMSEGMRPKGQELSVFYKRFEGLFQDKVGGNFSWATGEKAKLVVGFIRMTEAQGVRDRSQLEEQLDLFFEFIEAQLLAWVGWEKATRGNLLGFLTNKDQVQIFVAKKRKKSSDKTAESTGVVGTAVQDEWDR
jgi:hypothetical protein